MTSALPAIGVVVIGRNEGARLRRCLSVLRESSSSELPVVYVDSGSTDGSVEFARSVGAAVVELDLTTKFTAARARNAGFERLRQEVPSLRFVQFIDGDCELVSSWLSVATARLEADPELAVVCGRRRERHPEQTVFNRLCDLEWDTPVGEARACGGDALMRSNAFLRVGGFRETLIAGEEPELCFRLRQLGYKVERLDEEMTLHDAAMSKVSQWFQRTKRSGHAFAEMAALHGLDEERPAVRSTVSNLIWGVGVPGAVVGASAMMGPLVGGVGGALACGYLYRKSYTYELHRPGGARSAAEARLYAVACVAGKLPEALGALTYLKNRALGRASSLIEYKAPE